MLTSKSSCKPAHSRKNREKQQMLSVFLPSLLPFLKASGVEKAPCYNPSCNSAAVCGKGWLSGTAEPRRGWRWGVPLLALLFLNATCNLKAKNTPGCTAQTQAFVFFSFLISHAFLPKFDHATLKDIDLSSPTRAFCFRIITSFSNLWFLF